MENYLNKPSHKLTDAEARKRMKEASIMQRTNVNFTDDNKNFVRVNGAKNLDEAVTAADVFLDKYGMCVKNGGQMYGDGTEIEDGVILLNVG